MPDENNEEFIKDDDEFDPCYECVLYDDHLTYDEDGCLWFRCDDCIFGNGDYTD